MKQNEAKHIVFCLKCGGHFKVEETLKAQIASDNPDIDIVNPLYICFDCYDALPKTTEEQTLFIHK